ncbi:TPA: PblA [Streptococcus pneumoniae]|uniref:phage tail protein n=1 Tax=Streptococcus pneumoniae TaxID=1313 RepID=UPI00066A0F9A|nr:PblA [Streptococcus pneumoniae]CTN99079.1 putative prophage protein [Streptococcus pneumoniae]CTO06492.1 putative prophage protein [Streptococcus pneumoniae]HEU4066594.1 PblA [Streptococcus pneumoniae]HEU7210688.1 PblA [Streptococcus pneumoniae]HEU7348697.1 PblA [Streptococcus pneumoniae]
MATELGKAYVQIIPSAKGISGMIQKEMGGEVASAGVSAGESLGSKMMGAVSGVIAAAGIGKAIGASINEGAALQQSLGGVETLFKDSADKVKGFANEAYKTTGLSANAYMENVTGFSASLLQSLGGDTDKAAETANMAMIDMSDNANKMGTSMESIQLAYQGFAKQNYTMLDNLKLGYGGTKQEMQRLLADAEKLTGVKYDINNLSDVYSAIHTIQENLDITGTTAREAATTFTGSFESMKSAAQNVLGKLSLGEDIQPALQALMETTSTFLFGNLIPMIGNILKQIPILILGGIKGVFSGIFGEGLGSIMGSIVTALGSAFLAFKAFSTVSGLLSGIPAVLTTIKTAVTGLFTVMSANPIGIAIAAIAGLTAGLVYFFTQTETGRQIWSSFVAWIKQAWQGIADFFVNLWSGISEGASTLWDGVVTAWNAVVTFFSDLWVRIQEAASVAWTAITTVVMAIVQPFIDGFMNIWNNISDGLTQIWEGIKMIFQGVWEFIKSIFLGAILIIINLVTGNFNQLGADLSLIWKGIKNSISMIWEGIKTYFSGVVDVIVGYGIAIFENFSTTLSTIWKGLSAAGKAIFDSFAQILSNIWNTIKSVASSAWEGLKSTVLGLIDGLVQGAKNAWESMKQGVRDLVSNVTSIFDGIRNIDLWSAGKAILDGFLGGLKSAWGAVTDFVGGIASWIRDHKGPIEYDRKLLIPAGNAIMQGLDRGLQDRFKDVKKSVSGMAGEISNAFSNDDFGLSGTPTIAKNIEASLAMPSAQIEAKDSQTVSEIAILRASMEKILTAILEKPSDTYLDADKISMSVYQRQGAIYAREGM